MSSRIKGVSLINTLAILREVLGGNRFQALVSTCPQETQQLIRRTLIAGEWISVDVWGPFVHAVYEHVFRQDEVQFRRLLRAVCKRDFNTVYRQHVAQTSPQEVLDKSSSIFGAYFDGGSLLRTTISPSLTKDDLGPTAAEATAEETAEQEMAPPAELSLPRVAAPDDRIVLQLRDLETHFPVYAMAMHAYLEQALLMAGARHVTITRVREQLREGKLSADFLVDLGAAKEQSAS